MTQPDTFKPFLVEFDKLYAPATRCGKNQIPVPTNATTREQMKLACAFLRKHLSTIRRISSPTAAPFTDADIEVFDEAQRNAAMVSMYAHAYNTARRIRAH